MPTATRKDALRNRERILAIARDAVDGGARVQLNDIARLAGLGVATVYRHFPTPDALMVALAEDRLETLLAGRPASVDPWIDLVRFLELGLTAQLEDPALAAVLTGAGPLAFRERLTDRLRSLLLPAQASGRVALDVSAEDLLALVCGVVVAARSHGGEERSATGEIAKRYLHILLRGAQTPDRTA